MTHRCRGCHRTTIVEIVNLGSLRVPDFRADDVRPPYAPLRLTRCVACNLVQLGETFSRSELYTDGYGFYSGVNDRTRSELGLIVGDAVQHQERHGRHLRWLDIGCNDGTLLSFVSGEHHRVGVDPVAKFAELADKHADEVHVGLFDPDLVGDEFDVITSIAMFYDLDDPDEFVEQVRSVLRDDGLWVVQQNDLQSMLDSDAIDNVSHEHVTYWSLTTFCELLDRHDLRVVDVMQSNLNGGCMRCFIRHAASDRHGGQHHVSRWIGRERSAGLGSAEVYFNFRERTHARLDELHNLVEEITTAGDTVYVYGASNRGNTLWQGARVEDMITCAVERNTDKVGLNFSSIGIPIISEKQMRDEQPDYLLIGPWWFRDMFVEREAEYLRRGGALILPLPEVEVITA